MIYRSLICFRAWAAFVAAMQVHGAVTGSVQLTGQCASAAQKRRDLSGVVVWLDPVDAAARTPVTPGRAAMVQKDKKFSPHIPAVPVGTQVDFPNFDPIFHNAFSSFSGMPFDVGLYPPGTTRSVVFKRDGIVRVFCNIHQTMSAVIVVLKTPWFAVTNAQGNYQIAGVPAGNYRLHVFDERAGADELKTLERRLTVENGSAEIGPIAISEAGCLRVPHKK